MTELEYTQTELDADAAEEERLAAEDDADYMASIRD